MIGDRHYMRRPPLSSGWTNSPTIVLLVANLCVFIFQNVNSVYLGTNFEQYFALSPAGLAHGFVWQLLTFQFLHGGFLHFALNSLMLYMLGKWAESNLGTARMLEVYFGSGVAGGILQALLGWLIPSYFGGLTVGASAGIYGLLAAFCTLEPDRIILAMFVFPVRAWNLLIAALLIALFFVLVPSDRGMAHAAHLGGMLAAMAYVRWILRGERRLFDWRPYRGVVQHRELVRTASAKRSFWQRPKPVEEDDLPPAEFISREVDPILDKISAHGIQSLTDRERRILEAARAKMAKR